MCTDVPLLGTILEMHACIASAMKQGDFEEQRRKQEVKNMAQTYLLG